MGETQVRGSRLCFCGCGQPAKRHYSGTTFKAWRSYAAGHAPNEKICIRIPSVEVDLAYMAGILDGEGCIYARAWQRPNGYHTHIVVSVQMSSDAVIKWISDTFGGEVYTSKIPRGRAQYLYTWRVNGRNVAAFLKAVLPYLQEKKKRAIVGIELSELIGKSNFGKLNSEQRSQRENLCARIKAWNQSGCGESS